jgi:cytochrome oxidase Cu insertion factor (SCO1/SenC/PrrC family)
MRKRKSNAIFARPRLVFLITLLLGMLALTACGGSQSGDLAVGDEAPDFSLQDFNGQTVALNDFVGKQPVLLYFHMAVG